MSKEGTNLIIENTRASMVELPGQLNGEGVPVKLGMRLIPGQNNVPESEWNRVQNNKAVRMYVETKILIDKGPGKAKSFAEGLDVLEKHEALKQIHKCTDATIVRGWMDQTESPDYAKSCRDRIDAIIADKKAKESNK